MADSDSGLRQRSGKSSTKPAVKGSKTSPKSAATNGLISFLDLVRVLTTLVVVVLAISYYTTSGESLTYGYKPWFLNITEVKAYIRGPVQFTLKDLAKFDGSNPDLPLYISVNGTVFDVSKGRHMYGPGGSYNVFAGRDASRSFVTGCFQEDRTHDMRGAEDAFIPVEDAPDEKISSADRKNRAARERKAAKERAYNELKHWVDFFTGNPKYPMVGKVVLPEPKGPPAPLCAYAQNGRPKRSAQISQKAAEAAAGVAS